MTNSSGPRIVSIPHPATSNHAMLIRLSKPAPDAPIQNLEPMHGLCHIHADAYILRNPTNITQVTKAALTLPHNSTDNSSITLADPRRAGLHRLCSLLNGTVMKNSENPPVIAIVPPSIQDLHTATLGFRIEGTHQSLPQINDVLHGRVITGEKNGIREPTAPLRVVADFDEPLGPGMTLVLCALLAGPSGGELTRRLRKYSYVVEAVPFWDLNGIQLVFEPLDHHAKDDIITDCFATLDNIPVSAQTLKIAKRRAIEHLLLNLYGGVNSAAACLIPMALHGIHSLTLTAPALTSAIESVNYAELVQATRGVKYLAVTDQNERALNNE